MDSNRSLWLDRLAPMGDWDDGVFVKFEDWVLRRIY